jgi:hypothetical protein
MIAGLWCIKIAFGRNSAFSLCEALTAVIKIQHISTDFHKLPQIWAYRRRFGADFRGLARQIHESRD